MFIIQQNNNNAISDYIKTKLIEKYINEYPNIINDINSNPYLLKQINIECEKFKNL